ncbi:pseudouridine synthase [Mucilaginibacter sp.]|uniref:pseudouridine synthase n=1 Tax=Mucilaginibacter sp. TaxID=1882438 RepID=UPI00284FE0D9|nr:pseudouridine synthase [Mucilaginibacter sp.]MDR3696264.1 pseudouridine synthase [Mucilaginibacter sp.]
MVFKKPGSGRNDQSGRSSSRASKSDDRPKRASSSRGNSAKSSDRSDSSKPPRKDYSERPAEKRSFSSSGSKPYQSRQNDGDKPASSFSGGEKKSFTPKGRPYTGRPADNDDRPKRSFGGESSGGKKPFAPKSRPYTGRVADNDARPPKSFGGESSGGKKTFTSRERSAPSKFGGDERPKRSFGSDKPAEKKFSGRPSSAGAGGFKKREGDRPFSADRPQRSKPNYDKITPDQDAPAKTLRGRKKATESKDTGLIRLNRYISNAGICSRRKADELIAAGVVSVNGVVISELGHKVDPLKDEVRYNGEMLKREKMVYVLLNKPKDYITTTEDPHERRTVMNLVEKASKERIYPIGRLDRNTTGLLLMTNDGDLADKLSHPRNNIVKLYQVELSKSLTQGDLNKITYGLELEDGLIKPDSVSYVSGGSKREVGIQIHSGKNRIVRRIFEHLGYEVVKLDRVVYANLTKKDLPRGRWRYLDESEIIQLKHLI